MKIKATFAIIITICLMTSMLGCAQYDAAKKDESKITVVTTLFPLYDFVRHVGGEKVALKLLLPPGSESHNYEPSPSDIMAINDADMFLHTGEVLEPWTKKISDAISNEVVVTNAADGVALEIVGHDDDDHGEEDDDDHEEEPDPHIWLNPELAIRMVSNIEQALSSIDPENADYYAENANEYRNALISLDSDIQELVDASPNDTIVFAGRYAYHYFMKRYDLKAVKLIDNCSSDAEPSISISRMSEVINYIEDNGVKYIAHEELTNAAYAKSISDTTGAQTCILYMCHNVSKDDFAEGISYIDIMKKNLDSLKLLLSD